ncbi:MAG: hypothetical protein GXP04_12245 [Alphaproteobacteria bacterium]|nr:hypothetical protein [Alphaproteobacteria bacterium]
MMHVDMENVDDVPDTVLLDTEIEQLCTALMVSPSSHVAERFQEIFDTLLWAPSFELAATKSETKKALKKLHSTIAKFTDDANRYTEAVSGTAERAALNMIKTHGSRYLLSRITLERPGAGRPIKTTVPELWVILDYLERYSRSIDAALAIQTGRGRKDNSIFHSLILQCINTLESEDIYVPRLSKTEQPVEDARGSINTRRSNFWELVIAIASRILGEEHAGRQSLQAALTVIERTLQRRYRIRN